MLKSVCWRWLGIIVLVVFGAVSTPDLVWAAEIDPYVQRYLKASEPISLPLNQEGESRSFTADDLSVGKRLFEENCKSCHVGGATLPNPLVSLSLEDLKGATPPRNTIGALVAFQREPLTYDGQDFGFGCREVSERWLTAGELENLAAFVLRAAEVAPGWGIERF
ncbi:photosystem II cytochrome PsbV2 [Altericista sp. CCNU0014]|uniref:photosystem II cytochrome PsbV2 n=1 Tax=Altericista sp. CCNU0014 TaxID=3082949 RepID=UPI00384DC724